LAFLDEIMESLGLLPPVKRPGETTYVEPEYEDVVEYVPGPEGQRHRVESYQRESYAPFIGRKGPITPDQRAFGEHLLKVLTTKPTPPKKKVSPKTAPKRKDITKAAPEQKVLEKGKTPVQQEDPLGPLPYTGPAAWTGRTGEGGPDLFPKHKGPNFWATLLQNMFVPGKSPTGIPWIFPFLMSGLKGGDIWVRAWMGLRQQQAEKQKAKVTAKKAAYNQVMTNLRSGVIDDLTPEQRKYYSDIDPTLMEKRDYTKFQRYFWDKKAKTWIKEEDAIAQGMDVASMPMSGQEEEYTDWAVRSKTPLAKAEEKEQVARTMRAKNLAVMKRNLRARGYDPNSPEIQARLSEYVRTGQYETATPIETDGYIVMYDPVAGVVDRRVKIGVSPEEQAEINAKYRLEIEKELIKLRMDLKKEPVSAVELQTELEQRISGTYDRMIRAEISNLNRLRQLASNPMAMKAQGTSLAEVETAVRESQARLKELSTEMAAKLGALYGLLKEQGYKGLLKIDAEAKKKMQQAPPGARETGEIAARIAEVERGKKGKKKKKVKTVRTGWSR
jgi:hypothetical protein